MGIHGGRLMRQRVCELFAGVGGFHLGLARSGWEVVWSNQWEPGRKVQYASDCYVSHFGEEGHQNRDVSTVDATEIPDHELLVGGFPCQDYSVATANAKGIGGKKGVLWWEIRRILEAKRPPYLLLENVDRLLKSPTQQRGRDFGVMLWCLNLLGYAVEWRQINAADYSAPQRRRRVFIFGAHASTRAGSSMSGLEDVRRWVERDGFFAIPFPVVKSKQTIITPEEPQKLLPKTVQEVSARFAFRFESSGVAKDRGIWTYSVEPRAERPVPLSRVLQPHPEERYFVPGNDLPKWRYLKGAKAEKRKAATGFEYAYTEGALPFPDPLDRPGRTMLTDEGGLGPSRFKHIIEDPDSKRYRVLTPVEAERLNQFPDDWTNTGMPERMRFFCMGNALVVGLVERMGTRLRDLVLSDSVTEELLAQARRRVAVPA